MERTRRSLYFPMTYLFSGGLMMLLAPRLALRLLLSNADYGEVFPRFAGTLTIGLGILVSQVIRHRVTALYVPIIWVRVFFCTCYVGLFLLARDPFFLFMLVMVGFGAAMTAVSHARDRRASG